MVMDQFVTTYRKDYLWPYVKTLGIRPQTAQLYQPQYRDQQNVCPCHCLEEPRPTSEQQKVLGPHAADEQAWSRLGPMGPLLDPKLYPARVGDSPESKVSRYNQPNVFLQKLQEKYPFIYECLRTAPPDDLISRINRDRLRTTYQVDFCQMNEYPSAPYDELIRSAGVEGSAPCPEPVKLPGDPCRPNQRQIAFRISSVSKDCGNQGGRGSGRGDGDIGNKYCGNAGDGMLSWNPFSKEEQEYDPLLTQWGKMIERDAVHSHGFISMGRCNRKNC